MTGLKDFQHRRALISVRRSSIDDLKIQGFVLGVSDELVLLQYVYDLNLDGLMILRTQDISEVTSSKTDQFQEGLLEVEELLSSVPFDLRIDLSNWPAAIAEMCKRFPILIVERECLEEPDMAIGQVLDVGTDQLRLKYFTGAANWLNDPETLLYSDITCCQANTNYLNVYQRHFERKNEL
jgi:hypothetical protein